MKEKKWTEETLTAAIKELVAKMGKVPTWTEANAFSSGLAMAGFRLFGSWRLALKAAGFPDYPGNERWRMRVLREADKERLLEEIKTSENPSKEAIRSLLKERGFHRDPSLVAELQKATGSEPRTRPCGKCGVSILPPRKYCATCAKIVEKEKTKARIKRFLAKPENAARYREKVKLYQKRRWQEMSEEQKEKLRAKRREYYRQYYARKKEENPEAFKIQLRIKYYKEKLREILNNKPPQSPTTI
jgi:hypothetical protein